MPTPLRLIFSVLVPILSAICAEAKKVSHRTEPPVALSSLPVLLRHYAEETKSLVCDGSRHFVDFILPKWSADNPNTLPSMRELSQSPMEFMLRHFDANGDGHISADELLNMTEILKHLETAPESWASWFRREWPLMDWKIGVFLWRSFGGILLLLAFLSVVPGRLHGISGRVLRWPVLGMTYFLIVVELMVYVVIRVFIRAAEYVIARPKHRRLRSRMQCSKTYQEWYALAAELDKSQKRSRWLDVMDDRTSARYNWTYIRELIKDLRSARKGEDSIKTLAVLQQCTRKNVGGIMSEDLFCYSNTGEPKRIVKEFIEEVVASMAWLTSEAEKLPTDVAEGDENSPTFSTQLPKTGEKRVYEKKLQEQVRESKYKLSQSLTAATLSFFGNLDSSQRNAVTKPDKKEGDRKALSVFHRMEVLSFLKRAQAAYGRTALCLSGGAMMGLYHFGHVLGLLEAGTLPHIISGTSGGSVIGAIICTRTDEEIKRDLDPLILGPQLTCFSRPWSERLKSIWKTGCLFSFDEWLETIQWFTCGQTTFAEAYEKTGRVFCVTLSSTTKKAPPVLINHLTAPNVTVASAVIASAGVPGFIPPVRLQFKGPDGKVRFQEGETYFDGSIEHDIPVNGLAEMFNCQFFIACQCNPHVVPFFYNNKGGVGRPSRWSSGTQENSWRGGFLLAALELYLKNDMKAKFRFLHDLEVAVGFTSSMMVQEFVGSTTIVPQVSFVDYFRLFSDPKVEELYQYFQAGSVAAYEHIAMIKLHYSLVDIMDHCIFKLESQKEKNKNRSRPRAKILIPQAKDKGDVHLGSSTTFSSQEVDDEDEVERKWVQLSISD